MNSTEIKYSPLNKFFETLGYNLNQNNGFLSYPFFSNVESEYSTLINGVGLRDISNYTILELQGKDVIDFLHRITTNNLKDLRLHSSKRTIFTNEKGRILDSVQLLYISDFFILIGNPNRENLLSSWINKYVITDDVKAINPQEKYSLLEFIGPQVESFLTLIFGKSETQIQENEIKNISFGNFSYYLIRRKYNNNIFSYWILSTPEAATYLINYSLNNKGIFNFNLVSENAFEIFRIENGIPFVKEINDSFNPLELFLLDEVSFTKGCYIGQEVIARLDTYQKVQKYLSKFELEDENVIGKDFILFDEDENEIGRITSLTKNINGKYIALGFVRKNYLEEDLVLYTKEQNDENRIYKVKVKPIVN